MPNFGKLLKNQNCNLILIKVHLANQLQYQKVIILLKQNLHKILNMSKIVVLLDIRLA